MTTTATKPNKLAVVANELDDRYRLAAGLRRNINKVFPTHWSFMLGEIALYSFVILLLSGVYLTLFFDPSMTQVLYDGSYAPLQGIPMSRAYETALDISFDVRGGLFIRQVHHWAALLFVASIFAHLLRVFFTGAFRKPREANWTIGCVLLLLAIAEGFAGYSLPDDLLSGTGLRIMSAITLSIPVAGTWMHWLMFGGDFPGGIIIDRLYIAHVLLIPGILLALIAAHLALVWYQKHTQFPGPGATENNVVGVRIMPVFAAKASALFFITFGVVALLAGVLSINPIWNLGPYNPSQISAGSQPDWYMLWTDGAARVFPDWALYIGGYPVPAVFWVALLLGAVVTLLITYPMIEAKATGDKEPHNLLQRPRDVPVRTSFGIASISFFFILTASAANDLIAFNYDLSLNALTWAGRIGLIIVPPTAYFVTYLLCLALQHKDRQLLEHGVPTGMILRGSDGSYFEIHQPLGPVDDHGHPVPLPYEGATVPWKMNLLGSSGHPGLGSWLKADPIDEANELNSIAHTDHVEERSMYVSLQRENKELAEGSGDSSSSS